MFTALALVAFSGVSMANTIAKEETMLRMEKIDFIRKNPPPTLSCAITAAIQTMVANEAHTNETGSSWDQWTLDFVYATYLDACEN